MSPRSDKTDCAWTRRALARANAMSLTARTQQTSAHAKPTSATVHGPDKGDSARGSDERDGGEQVGQ
jgi:hypothetical protein